MVLVAAFETASAAAQISETLQILGKPSLTLGDRSGQSTYIAGPLSRPISRAWNNLRAHTIRQSNRQAKGNQTALVLPPAPACNINAGDVLVQALRDADPRNNMIGL